MTTPNNAQHTPGPWRIGADNCGNGANINAGKNDYIGHTCGHEARPGSNERTLSESEAKANARLIAAAPELLAKLAVIAHDLDVIVGADDPSRYIETLAQHAQAARALIAKAEGRAE